ncbi:MAG: OmpH family outer membrane protein [Rhodobacteraceae bacterium]|nr:OmpH family outer membrane protein [Paracoccaceae bacterium]
MSVSYRCVIVVFLATIGWTSVGSAEILVAPESPILTIESDRLYSDSLYGAAAAEAYESESAVLAAENRRIEAELTAEEKQLSKMRPDMEPVDFRVLADAFDEKVQRNKLRDLSQRHDARRVIFLRAARPILEGLMLETGASILLERSSVLLSANAIDVTGIAIGRIDAAIGDGSKLLIENADHLCLAGCARDEN